MFRDTGSGLPRRQVLRLTGGLAAAGLVGTASGRRPSGSGVTGDDGPALSFDEPVRLNPPGTYGYEPSVSVDEFGTIYATAHKSSVTNEGTRLSSWFWHSTDGGETFEDMPTEADLDNKQYAFEGDIAIDGAGSVYFLDTYLADNHFNSWVATPGGPVWDYSTPVQGTSALDDRPWLRAHGDGLVYYLGNNGGSVPSPNDGTPSRIWFYRSTDGGLTWSEGFGFPTAGYCSLAEDRSAPVDGTLDGKRIYVATDNGGRLEIYHTTDAGQTWTYEGQDGSIYQFDNGGSSDPFGTWSVTDRAGNPYHTFIDDDPTDKRPGQLKFVRGEPGAWEVLDVTPFEGAFTKQWIGAGSEGTVVITFNGTAPGVVNASAGGGANWYAYALVTTNALADAPDWTLAQLGEYPVATDGTEPEDFFECAIGPQDDIHVTFGRETPNGGGSTGRISNETRTYRNNLFYIRGSIEGTGERDEEQRGPPEGVPPA